MATLGKLLFLPVAIIFVLLNTIVLCSNAQNAEFPEDEMITTDSITIGKQGTKQTYHLGRATLDSKELKELLATEPLAISNFRGGQALTAVGAVACVGGSFLFGFSLGQAIGNTVNSTANQRPDGSRRTSMHWAVFGAGLGGLAAGAVMLIGGKQLKTKAVHHYNSKLDVRDESSSIMIRPASNGLGVAFVF